MILREATIRFAGYDSDSLSHASEKRVCVSCDNPECKNPIRWVRFNHYTDLCRSCTQRGKRNHAYGKGLFGEKNGMYGKKHTKENIEKQKRNQPNNKGLNNSMYGLKGKDNPCFGLKHSEEQNKNHSEFMTGRFVGELAPNWKGGIAGNRDHAKHECNCIKMNDKFIGSEFHHIISDVGIYIPKELHRHIWHNMKNGLNMGEINALAIQYLNGGLEI